MCWKPSEEGACTCRPAGLPQPMPKRILSLASFRLPQLVLAVGGRTLVYLELGEGEIVEKARVELESDIACLDVTPLGAGSLHSWRRAPLGLQAS